MSRSIVGMSSRNLSGRSVLFVLVQLVIWCSVLAYVWMKHLSAAVYGLGAGVALVLVFAISMVSYLFMRMSKKEMSPEALRSMEPKVYIFFVLTNLFMVMFSMFMNVMFVHCDSYNSLNWFIAGLLFPSVTLILPNMFIRLRLAY